MNSVFELDLESLAPQTQPSAQGYHHQQQQQQYQHQQQQHQHQHHHHQLQMQQMQQHHGNRMLRSQDLSGLM